MLLVGAARPADAADPDAIAILPLNEGSGLVAGDISGQGNDGALIGSPVYDASTADGSPFSLRFDGVDDYVDLGSLDVNGSGLTLACWFFADAYPGPSNDPRIISKATGTLASDHVFMIGTVLSGSAIRLRARVRVGGLTTTLVASSGDLVGAVWYHAALTYEGTTLRLYLDGVEVGSTPLSGPVDTDPAVPVAVGNQPPGAGDRFFLGLIDDARILQRGLSESEVLAIIGGNQPPVAARETYGTNEDAALLVPAGSGVLANDTDPELDVLSALLAGDVTSGVLNLNADGSFDYAPDFNFFGTDSFTYWASDGSSNSNLATAVLVVAPVDDKPVAVDDGYQTMPDTPLLINAANGVLDNDLNPDSEPLWAALVGGPAHGTLALQWDGSFDYTPDTGFNGTDTFVYRVKDAQPFAKPYDGRPHEEIGRAGAVDGTPDMAKVTITVAQPPTATGDSYTTGEDTTLVIAAPGLLSNDTDNQPPADLTAVQLTSPVLGTLAGFMADGAFTYVPDPNANGVDSFTYQLVDGATGASDQATVIITVNPVNDAPLAVNDNYQAAQNTPLVVIATNGVLDNDTDVEVDPLQAVLEDDVSSGVLTLNADGSFDYTPNTDFVGIDSFTYRADDAVATSNSATVTINVTATSDPDAVVILPLDENGGALAVDISGNGNDGTLEGGAVFETTSGDGSLSSVRLDGTNDYIDLGPVDVDGSGLTLACWFKADDFPGATQDPRLISKAAGPAANAHVFMLSTIEEEGVVRLRGRVRIGGLTTTLIAGAGGIVVDEWRHAAMTYDGAALRLYLDGAEVGSAPLSGTVDSAPSMPVAVGGQPAGVEPRYFDGLIDDVRILQRAMGAGELAAIAGPAPEPVIEVWYGDVQDFGYRGNPQTLIQIMGHVRETAPLVALSFRVNGGASQGLTVGPDFLRLPGWGDYNIEIYNTSLNVGANTVSITADDVLGGQSVKNVTVNYAAGVVWSLPDTLDWQGATAVTDEAQVVDGRWYLEGNGVRTVPTATGYDRLLAVGDYTWVPDYEAVMPVTVHEIVVGGAVGFAVGWQGHTGPQSPMLGHPYEAIGWVLGNGRLQMLRNGDGVQAEKNVSLVLETTYMLRIRTQTLGGGLSNVKVKWWAASNSEPSTWDMSENVTTVFGSALLIAHMADVTFGEVLITTLSGGSVSSDPPPDVAGVSPPSIRELTVRQNTPNPFSGGTDIQLGLPEAGDVLLQVYDVRGREVYEASLPNVPRGWSRIHFDGRGPTGRKLAGGVYFYKITTHRGAVARKMVITR